MGGHVHERLKVKEECWSGDLFTSVMTNKKCNTLYGHVVVSHLALMMCKNMLQGNVQDKVKKIQLDELGVRMDNLLIIKKKKQQNKYKK